MNYREFEYLIPEYLDGTLDSDRRKDFEAFLAESLDARNNLENIQTAFDVLRSASVPDVPTHYFSNFVTRLRHRIDTEQTNSFRSWAVPAWVNRAFAPFLVVIIISSFAGLYEVMKPAEPAGSILSIVKDIDQNQYTDAVQDVSLFSNDSPVISENTINHALVGSATISSLLTDDDIISDRQILAQMDESDIEYALARLTTVQ